MPEAVKGLKKLKKVLQGFPKRLEDNLDVIVLYNALEIERNAKRNAPIDYGDLRQSIMALGQEKLSAKVFTNVTGLAPYAPYVEFGTGGLVEVPSELQEIASQFRGKGIKKINLRPRPFMYPALLSQRPQFLKDIENLLEKSVKNI